jgi:hypothetical protein
MISFAEFSPVWVILIYIQIEKGTAFFWLKFYANPFVKTGKNVLPCIRE